MGKSTSSQSKKKSIIGLRATVPLVLRGVAGWGLVAAGIFVVFRLLWDGHQSAILSNPRFVLTADEIEARPLPNWIHEDPRPEFLLAAGQEGEISLADPDCLPKLVRAIQSHPWVKKVERAAKRYPGVVAVRLEYRRPVAMVRVPGGLLPIDEEGTLLPTRDFTPLEAARYPRIEGIPSLPKGPAGTLWGDYLVKEGATLASLFLPVWVKFQLRCLQPHSGGPDKAVADFEIVTRGGSVIIWGPVGINGSQQGNNSTAQAKLEWLEQYYREHGSFEGLDGLQVIDLRPAKPVVRPLTSPR